MQDPVIKISHLNKRFGSSEALKDIHFEVPAASIFGIIGMSGAGKSTLVRTLTCLEKPTSGEIYLNGIDLTRLSPKELRVQRKKMGLIFQHFNLFSSRTVLGNVCYPLEITGVPISEQKTRAHAMLELVGLSSKADQYPATLSGGEKQRVAIARALIHGPDLLLCDEATSALDPHTTRSILELLASLNQKLSLTILMITHDMEVVKQICTHVAVLEAGTIVEQGSALELFATPKHPTTKRFLQNLTHEIPDRLLSTIADSQILHLSFTGESAGRPLISHLVRSYQVDVNILMGGIDVLKTGTVGNLVIALSGSAEERQKACKFLVDHGVMCEPIT